MAGDRIQRIEARGNQLFVSLDNVTKIYTLPFPIYPDADSYHFYNIDVRLKGISSAGDSDKYVFKNLAEAPAPKVGISDLANISFNEGNPYPINIFDVQKKTGDITNISIFGIWPNDPVRHIVDQENQLIINITVPGHQLYPGIVVRHVYKDGLHLDTVVTRCKI